MLKIIHCGDVHLDSPFTGGDALASALKRRELLTVFGNLISYIKRENINICLIAGDLFDCEFITRDTINTVLDHFRAASFCRFYISPGNHDPYTLDSIYAKLTFPQNVHIFKTESFSKIAYDENTDIYGYAFLDVSMDVNPFINFKVEDKKKLNIAVCHADMTAAKPRKYCPVGINDIKGCGFDYVALGHIHESLNGIQNQDGVYYGYSGCLQGRNFGETGYKGAYQIIYSGISKAPEIKFIRFSTKRYMIEKLDISGCSSYSQINDRINSLIREKGYGRETCLRVELYGEIDAEFTYKTDAFIDESGMLQKIEIEDKTFPCFDFFSLEKDPTIRGAFYMSLKDMIENGDKETQATAMRALRYGFAALSGNDIL